MAEFDVGNHTYRSNMLGAFDQLHIARRLAPVFTAFFDILGAIPPSGDGGTKQQDIFEMLGSDKLDGLAKAISEMEDEQVDYILTKCLSVCQRGERDSVSGAITGWNPLWNKIAKKPQYELPMMEMLQIAQHVLQENVGGFFPTSR